MYAENYFEIIEPQKISLTSFQVNLSLSNGIFDSLAGAPGFQFWEM